MIVDPNTYTFVAPNGYTYGIWALMRYGGTYTGSYPSGFLQRAKRLLGDGEWLHLFSGSVRGDTTFDADPSTDPTIVGQFEDGLPFEDNSFDAVLVDPPYKENVGSTRGFKLPSIKSILKEATRVTKPRGKVGLLHWIVPATPDGCVKYGCIGVITGANKRIRAFTIFEKEERQ